MTDRRIDTEALTAALTRELSVAWDALRERARDERIYSFAIFTSGEWGYLLATGNTVEGLERAVQAEVARGDSRGASMAREALRWSYCDSEFHGALPELTASQALLQDDAASREESEFEAYVEAVCSCCVEALRLLDAGGTFGADEARGSVALNIVMGDMSEEFWDEGLKELNPEATYLRYSRLHATAESSAARTAGMTPAAQAAYWVTQYVECAEGHLWHPHTTCDGFDRMEIENALVQLGVAAVPAIVSEIERAVLEPTSYVDRAESELGPLWATPALRAFGILFTLGRIGTIDDGSVDRLRKLIARLVARDETREWTDPSAENLARMLYQLRPKQFPPTQLDPHTNHLRNPAAFVEHG